MSRLSRGSSMTALELMVWLRDWSCVLMMGASVVTSTVVEFAAAFNTALALAMSEPARTMPSTMDVPKPEAVTATL